MFIVDMGKLVLSASCLVLEIKKFRCYEAKIEGSEKVSSRTQDTSGRATWEVASKLGSLDYLTNHKMISFSGITI